MKKRFLLLMPFLVLGMSIAACDQGGGGGSVVIEPTGITLNLSSITMDVGDTKELIPTITPVDVTDKNIKWDSTNSTVASVENGVVKALTVGNTTISASIASLTAKCEVTVKEKRVEPTLESIKVSGYKETYEQGEELNLIVKAVYSDESEVTLLTTDYTISGYDKNTVGQQNVTVTYKDKTATFATEVVAKQVATLEGIRITKLPTKTEYNIGQELSTSGLEVTAIYSDGLTKEVFAYELSGYDKNVAGKQTITVTYQGKTATFEVNVKEQQETKTLQGIEISHLPNKVEYEIGEELDTNGLEVQAVYTLSPSGLTKKEVVTDYTLSRYDSSTAGNKAITVTYQEKTANFGVKYLEPITLLDIQLDTTNVKKTYTVDQDLDLTGLVVTAKYNRGDDQVIPVGQYSSSGFVKGQVGRQEITISYQNKTASFFVEVEGSEPEPVLQSIILDTDNVKKEYELNEQLDLTGLVVKAHYDKGEDVVLSVGQYEVSTVDMSTAGTKTITISYGRQTATFDIRVKAAAPVVGAISANTEAMKTVYETNEEIDLTGLVVYALYGDGSLTPLADDAYSTNAATIDMSTAGEKVITVLYNGLTTTFKITVNEPASGEFKPFVRVIGGNDYVLQDNPDPEKNEYYIRLKLDAASQIKFSLADNDTDWRGYSFVKNDVTVDIEEGRDGNIEFNVGGTYDFYISKAENGQIWIEEYIEPTPEKALVSIAVTHMPDKSVYYVGEEFVEGGLEITATYSDASKAVVEGYELSGFDSSAANEKVTITVTYEEKEVVKTTTFEIKVVVDEYLDKYVMHYTADLKNWDDLDLTPNGDSSEYSIKNVKLATDGELVFCLGGGENWYKYADLKLANNLVAQEKFDAGNDGNIKIIVGGTYDFYVKVDAESNPEDPNYGKRIWVVESEKVLESIAVTHMPNKTSYYVNEELDATGLEVTATFTDESKAVVKDYQLSGFDSSAAGKVEVTVTYGGKTTSFEVTVEVDPYLDQYVMHYSVDGESWLDTPLIKKDAEEEYFIKAVQLETGTQLAFCLGGGSSWHHYKDIKPSSPAANNFTATKAGDLQVAKPGLYSFYVVVNAPTEGKDAGKYIYIASYTPMTISANSATIEVGESENINVYNPDGEVIATSGNEAIATASYNDGKVVINAIGEGETDITIKDDMTTLKVHVEATVTPIPMDVDKTVVTVIEGQTAEVTVSHYEGEISAIPDDPQYATARVEDNKVIITGVAVGNAVITINDEGGGMKQVLVTINADPYKNVYVIHFQGDDMEWHDLELTAKDEGAEYFIKGLGLSKGAGLVFCIGGNWYKYADIKPTSPAKDKFTTDEAGNLVVAETGKYNFFVAVNAPESGDDQGKRIYIAAYDAYEDQYVMHLTKDGEVWKDSELTKKDAEEEYYIEQVKLDAGDILIFTLGGGDKWYGYSEIKASSPMKDSFAAIEDSKNIKVTKTGTYTFYIMVNGDPGEGNKRIYVAGEVYVPMNINVEDNRLELTVGQNLEVTINNAEGNINIGNRMTSIASHVLNENVMTITANGVGRTTFTINDGVTTIELLVIVSEAPANISVAFTINYGTNLGDSIYILGDFCDWEMENAVVMNWTEGNNWTVTMEKPENTVIKYKFVVAVTNNPTEYKRIESGDDRVTTFDAATSASGVNASWK